ncbi:PD-(D/E)XK nuclease family protein [Commensalibacter nepenthis]|uniref:PD-(D/E)XK nuclease family protein n=1 Tax=Commensalibacter nepenthis TaxID=3043872 RepID=A0ABT6Q8M9_9PROT|nr:PD-(D/E)XK nuclease family protein [Commensalibacter sp. TBRC 10068]MDI2113254.1 PD-(D/E)XK nuclease family protein [Commensalibacter sp. TBRC 10068]
MDVLVIINKQEIIIIEDKIFSSEHSNQLERYAEIIKKEYNTEHIHKVYFKMHEQGNYNKVNAAGYTIYTRENMLRILKEYITSPSSERKNDILVDFYNKLNEIDHNINKYLTEKINQWDQHCWQGFYIALQKIVLDEAQQHNILLKKNGRSGKKYVFSSL